MGSNRRRLQAKHLRGCGGPTLGALFFSSCCATHHRPGGMPSAVHGGLKPQCALRSIPMCPPCLCFVSRLCSGCPLDICLCLLGAWLELEPKSESKSCAWGAEAGGSRVNGRYCMVSERGQGGTQHRGVCAAHARCLHGGKIGICAGCLLLKRGIHNHVNYVKQVGVQGVHYMALHSLSALALELGEGDGRVVLEQLLCDGRCQRPQVLPAAQLLQRLDGLHSGRRG